MAVVVFGSINMDLVVRAATLPTPGQTITGQTFATVGGGKGANQAVACARLGTVTHLIGCVGADDFGAALRQSLAGYGVAIQQVTPVADAPTGIALITVENSGENTIVIVPGANAALNAEAAHLIENISQARVLLLQLEVPLPAVIAAAQVAHSQGRFVILDPAPAQLLPEKLYQALDVITPNESEAAVLVGFPVDDEASASEAAQLLLARGPHQVLIKMGSKGVFWANNRTRRLLPTYRVTAVDTVAAGDAFNGGLASALDAQLPFEDAIRWGLATAALAVTRLGAHTAMPSRAEVLELLNAH